MGKILLHTKLACTSNYQHNNQFATLIQERKLSHMATHTVIATLI